MPRRTPGTANRVLALCRLLNRHRAQYLLAGGVAAKLTVAWSVSFDEAWPRRMVRRIEGVRVPYLSLEDLLASKRTGRASDRADVEVLRSLLPRKNRKR